MLLLLLLTSSSWGSAIWELATLGRVGGQPCLPLLCLWRKRVGKNGGWTGTPLPSPRVSFARLLPSPIHARWRPRRRTEGAGSSQEDIRGQALPEAGAGPGLAGEPARSFPPLSTGRAGLGTPSLPAPPRRPGLRAHKNRTTAALVLPQGSGEAR